MVKETAQGILNGNPDFDHLMFPEKDLICFIRLFLNNFNDKEGYAIKQCIKSNINDNKFSALLDSIHLKENLKNMKDFTLAIRRLKFSIQDYKKQAIALIKQQKAKRKTNIHQSKEKLLKYHEKRVAEKQQLMQNLKKACYIINDIEKFKEKSIETITNELTMNPFVFSAERIENIKKIHFCNRITATNVQDVEPIVKEKKMKYNCQSIQSNKRVFRRANKKVLQSKEKILQHKKQRYELFIKEAAEEILNGRTDFDHLMFPEKSLMVFIRLSLNKFNNEEKSAIKRCINSKTNNELSELLDSIDLIGNPENINEFIYNRQSIFLSIKSYTNFRIKQTKKDQETRENHKSIETLLKGQEKSIANKRQLMQNLKKACYIINDIEKLKEKFTKKSIGTITNEFIKKPFVFSAERIENINKIHIAHGITLKNIEAFNGTIVKKKRKYNPKISHEESILLNQPPIEEQECPSITINPIKNSIEANPSTPDDDCSMIDTTTVMGKPKNSNELLANENNEFDENSIQWQKIKYEFMIKETAKKILNGNTYFDYLMFPEKYLVIFIRLSLDDFNNMEAKAVKNCINLCTNNKLSDLLNSIDLRGNPTNVHGFISVTSSISWSIERYRKSIIKDRKERYKNYKITKSLWRLHEERISKKQELMQNLKKACYIIDHIKKYSKGKSMEIVINEIITNIINKNDSFVFSAEMVENINKIHIAHRITATNITHIKLSPNKIKKPKQKFHWKSIIKSKTIQEKSNPIEEEQEFPSIKTNPSINPIFQVIKPNQTIVHSSIKTTPSMTNQNSYLYPITNYLKNNNNYKPGLLTQSFNTAKPDQKFVSSQPLFNCFQQPMTIFKTNPYPNPMENYLKKDYQPGSMNAGFYNKQVPQNFMTIQTSAYLPTFPFYSNHPNQHQYSNPYPNQNSMATTQSNLSYFKPIIVTQDTNQPGNQQTSNDKPLTPNK